jgi:hypothetical protein
MMERFLDIHMYITAALQKTDMRAVGLHLAMDLLYEKVEIISHNTNVSKAFFKHQNVDALTEFLTSHNKRKRGFRAL